MVARDLQTILYRLHDQREKLAPSLQLRRQHLTSAFHAQIRAEKDNIEGFIGRMPLGLRRVYLNDRLQLLDARSRMRPVVGL